MATELGHFLTTRRARVTPREVGLPDLGRWRRVPGLRREEVAELAGISASYYTRLEHGASASASPSVLDAIARALRLTPVEHAHLVDLARLTTPHMHRPRIKHPIPAAIRMLKAIGAAPAILMGHYTDILAWNPAGHLLIAPHLHSSAPDDPTSRPVMARLLFLDPDVRAMYDDWEQTARINVGYLRFASGRHPDDARLAALIGELSMHSPAFARIWACHDVHECTFGTRTLHHPAIGDLRLDYQVWTQPDDPDLRLQIYTPRPGESEETLLDLLGPASQNSATESDAEIACRRQSL